MPRILFEKKGNAVWISHLDLMRLFQRAFKRAGLPLTHTQGFNPRPSVSIALPLSVGVESGCELLDFDLDGQDVPNEEICARLNAALVDGVKVLRVYDDGRKIKHLALLDCAVSLEYDAGVPDGGASAVAELFAQPSLTVEKKGKNGVSEQDIIPMIRVLQVRQEDAHTLRLEARVCCQNPTLNPMQLAAAVERYLPQCRPDFAKCSRIEIYDTEENIFR
jgi:radical SAM-linked protein